MTTSRNRYFKLREEFPGTFYMLEDSHGNHFQTLQVAGLETACKVAKKGFHFWVFLPDDLNVVKCLACSQVIKLGRERKQELEKTPDAGEFADPKKSSGTPQ